MADESHYPHWDRMSDAVKDILRQAKRWSAMAKKSRAYCNHILQALAKSYPEEIQKMVPQLNLEKIELILRKASLPPGHNISDDVVINRAAALAEEMDQDEILIRHLAKAASEYASFEAYKEIPKSKTSDPQPKTSNPQETQESKKAQKSATPTLDVYGKDLTALVAQGKIQPVIGRDHEVDLVIDTLCRVFKRNPLLVGPAGSGKTAIVEGLAYRIATGNIATALVGKRLVEINMGSLLAGTKYRGMFEERLMLIIKEASQPNIILFIDEFQSVVGTGVAEDSPLDASTILLPALARGELSCIGACTGPDYHKHIEKNRALDRRFQTIRIPELGHAATREVLQEIGPKQFEQKHNIHIHEEVYEEVVVLADRYMRNRYFPDKAIDILDQAVGQAVRKEMKEVNVEDIRNVLGSLTGLPIGKLENELRNRLEGLSSFLKSRILGQDHVIDVCADIIWPNTLGVNLRPERPNGVFLFTGPTGVGKTGLARSISEYLFGSPKKMIRVDMSEYAEEHTVSRLLGAPFGYKGFDEGSPFLNEIAENPFSVLLLDEIEKAHPAIHRLFLQVFDSGVLTDMQRQHIYFSDVIIIMTSNVLVKERATIGYGNEKTSETDYREQLKSHFAPEFLNRIDYVGAFNHLTGDIALQIVQSRIVPVLKKRWKDKNIQLEFTPEAVHLIAEKGCTEKWGARNLERTVNESINAPLAKIISSDGKGTCSVLVKEKNKAFEFEIR